MGLSADAAMQLLREAMEGLMVPDQVSRTLFEALGEYGGNLPERGKELRTFVDGPLSRALVRRVDIATRDAILDRLRPILDAIIQSEIPPPSSMIPPVQIPHRPGWDETTERRLTTSRPYVLVVAKSSAMERRLRMAVGQSLGSSTVKNAVEVHAALLAKSPRLILVDASSPVDIPLRELARALARANADSLVVVWGCTRPLGANLLGMMATAVPQPMGLEEAEGVEPLLDLVRSHGMQEPAVFARPAEAEPAPDEAAPKPAAGPPSVRPTPRYGEVLPARRRERDDD